MSQRSSGAVRGAACRHRGAAVPLRGFAPIIDDRVERLILGSFPSAASLAAGQYYAHPRNQFWAILGRLLGEPLAELAVRRAPPARARSPVGIWDVYGACERRGQRRRGDPPCPSEPLRAPAPPGAAAATPLPSMASAAGRFRPLFEQAGLAAAVLPSTSPAHAGRSLEQKLALWAAWWRAPRGGLVPGPVPRPVGRRGLTPVPGSATLATRCAARHNESE